MAISVIANGFSNVKLKRESGTVSAFARAQGGDNFILEASVTDIRNYVRHGDDLIIEFDDGQRLTIKDFFGVGAEYHNLILESEGVKHFVDFAAALQTPTAKQGDGVDEAMIRHQPIDATAQNGVSAEAPPKDANIDYDTIVSSVDSGGKQGGLSNWFSGKSFVSILGGLGAIGAAAEYAYNGGNNGENLGNADDPFKDMETPDALIPPPPKDADAGAETEGVDLRFFTTGPLLIETRILKNGTPLPAESFAVPIQIGKMAEKALTFLNYLPNSSNPNYLNIFAKISGSLGAGERVQLRSNAIAGWQDAIYDKVMDEWRFSEDLQEDLQEAELYRIDSRIIDAEGNERRGASLSPDELYNELSAWTQENMFPIARIDYTQKDKGKDLMNLIDEINEMVIGGTIIGEFGDDYRVQIRFGDGWYDTATAELNGDGSHSWHIDIDNLPTLTSTADNDSIQLEDDTKDTIVYRLLDEEDATGGNGADLIYNFKTGEWGDADVDRIDVASLFIKYNPLLNIKEDGGLLHYLSSIYKDGNTEIYIDRDGLGDKFEDTSLLFTLVGVKTDIEALYNNDQLIVC